MEKKKKSRNRAAVIGLNLRVSRRERKCALPRAPIRSIATAESILFVFLERGIPLRLALHPRGKVPESLRESDDSGKTR